MSSNIHNADSSCPDEDLVAYLDGELDEASGRRIEKLLAEDPEVRGRLQQLERTWSMLDRLTPVVVEEDFAHTTLEMVTVAAGADLDQKRRDGPGGRYRRWLTSAATLVVAGVTGFLIVALAWPDPNRALLDDLPVLENLDQYEQARDLEFLRMLHQEGLFAEEHADDS